MFKNNIKPTKSNFQNWEKDTIFICIAVLVIIVILEFICKCISDRFPISISVFVGLSTGIVSAVFVLYFQRLNKQQDLLKYYSKIEGDYKRIDMGQDNTGDKENGGMVEQNCGLSIKIKYLGENAFSVAAEYWKDNNAQVTALIEFNETNKMVAHGRYHYINDGEFKGHFGTYTVYRFEENDNKLLVLFHHVFPRKLANNPDSNKGWEIWEKANR